MANKSKSNDEMIYHCVSGFVPGLPEECSLKQAREMGENMEKEFLAAVENGIYVLGPTPTPAPSSSEAQGDKE